MAEQVSGPVLSGCWRRAARGVEIGIDDGMIGMRYPVLAHLAGDTEKTPKLLNSMQRRKQDRSGEGKIEEDVQTWNYIMADRADQVFDGLIDPQAMAAELSLRIPDGVILTSDSGTEGEMAGAAHRYPGRDGGVAVRHADDDEPGRAVRHCGAVRLPCPPSRSRAMARSREMA